MFTFHSFPIPVKPLMLSGPAGRAGSPSFYHPPLKCVFSTIQNRIYPRTKGACPPPVLGAVFAGERSCLARAIFGEGWAGSAGITGRAYFSFCGKKAAFISKRSLKKSFRNALP
jgi:hypothetical protein